MVFVRFLKKTTNFTRFCAFAQKAKFYALKMLKKQNLTHPKATKLATLYNIYYIITIKIKKWHYNVHEITQYEFLKPKLRYFRATLCDITISVIQSLDLVGVCPGVSR